MPGSLPGSVSGGSSGGRPHSKHQALESRTSGSRTSDSRTSGSQSSDSQSVKKRSRSGSSAYTGIIVIISLEEFGMRLYRLINQGCC